MKIIISYRVKFSIYILIGLLISSCTYSTAFKNNASISFLENEHDFGKIKYQIPTSISFEFSNTSNNPLLIQKVKTSCGCTKPEWTNKPISSGKKGNIIINYDSAYPGVFHKTITVFYNGEGSPDTLVIKGNVEYPIEMNTE